MAENKVFGSASRLALALTLVSMSACLKDDSGSGASQTGLGVATPVLWVDQSLPTAASTGVPGDSPLNWIDATTVTPTGGGAILPSTDEVTYGFPARLLPIGDPSLTHQLQVNSNAVAILNPEDQLAQAINTHRQVSAGFGNVGGVGVGGFGGGGGGGQVGTVMLPMSNKIRKNARAHCKHYGVLANNHPGALPLVNAEGDNILSGGVAPNGRLPKTGTVKQPATATQTLQLVLSGAAYPDATSARNFFVTNNGAQLTNTQYNYMGIGHWPAGDQSYYWDVIFALNPNPVN